MLPVLFKIGPVPVFAYGLMIATGFLLGLFFIKRDAERQGIKPEVIVDGAFWCLMLGLIGARLLHIIMFPGEYSFSDPLGWIAIWHGGLVFQGCIPGPIIFALVYLRVKKISFWKVADIVFPYIPLGHAFGRLGCFLNGCCYGQRTDLPWGIPFRRIPSDLSQPANGSPPFLDHRLRYGLPADAQWSLPVHPTQLYSAAGLLMIFAVMMYVKRNFTLFRGWALPSYLMLYSFFRFFVEFIRGDHNPSNFGFGVLSDQQIFCIVSFIFGAALFVYMRQRARRRNEFLPVEPAKS